MVDNLFIKIIKRFKDWLRGKPTGQFVIEINVNQGGVRGIPKISVTDDL